MQMNEERAILAHGHPLYQFTKSRLSLKVYECIRGIKSLRIVVLASIITIFQCHRDCKWK